jgi:hypothetical protein
MWTPLLNFIRRQGLALLEVSSMARFHRNKPDPGNLQPHKPRRNSA